MMDLVFWGIVFVLYVWVWTRPKKVEPSREPPVIDRRWHVRDRDEGGYIIFVEKGVD